MSREGSLMPIVAMFLVLLLIVTSCNDKEPLTPFQCRVTGVVVRDDDTITGQVANETGYHKLSEVKAACQQPFNSHIYGCAVPIAPGLYNIHYYLSPGSFNQLPSNYNNYVNHERCHAYYEERKHL